MDKVLETLLHNMYVQFTGSGEDVEVIKKSEMFKFTKDITIGLYDAIENKDNIRPMIMPVEMKKGIIFEGVTRKFDFVKEYDASSDLSQICPCCGITLAFTPDDDLKEEIIENLSKEINDVRNRFDIFRPFVLFQALRAVDAVSFMPKLGFRTRYGIKRNE